MDEELIESIDDVVNCFEFEEIDNALADKKYAIGNELTFALSQKFRALEGMAEVDPKELKPYVKKWFIRYKDEENENLNSYDNEATFDQMWLQFLSSWKKVKYPKGMLLPSIAKKAFNRMPDEADQFEDPTVKRALAICYQLQLDPLPGPFFLSNKVLGNLVGKSEEWARHTLNGFVELDLLEIAKKNTRHKATEYWYVPLKEDCDQI